MKRLWGKEAWWHRGHPCWWEWNYNREVLCSSMFSFFPSILFLPIPLSFFLAIDTHSKPHRMHNNEKKAAILTVGFFCLERWPCVYFWFKTSLSLRTQNKSPPASVSMTFYNWFGETFLSDIHWTFCHIQIHILSTYLKFQAWEVRNCIWTGAVPWGLP